MINPNYSHILFFNGCPKFFGSLEECKEELERRCAGVERIKRFYSINSRENVEAIAQTKIAIAETYSNVHSAPKYDRFGDVIYY